MIVNRAWSSLFAALALSIALAAATAGAQEAVDPADLPEVVAQSFATHFPDAKIHKLTGEEEFGVMVYDFEFAHAGEEKETDIAGDGTMMEHTLVIEAADIPAPAMKSIQAAAKGAKLGRLERIAVQYEPKDGKVVRLPEELTRYAAEMHKGKKMAEVVVDPKGGVVAEPEWIPAPAPAPAKPEK
jgi:hypothetical protein